MTTNQDDKTPQDQRDDAVREAVRFAVKNGANEDELERIVQHAGVPRAYLSRTIADTRTAMDSLLSWTYRRLMSVLDHPTDRDHDPLHTLKRIFESHVWFVVRNPGIAKLLRHILGNPHSRVRTHVQKIMRVYEYEIAIILQDAKSKGLIRDDINPKVAATMFVGMVQAHMLRMHILGNATIVRNEARMLLDHYLHGIRTAT